MTEIHNETGNPGKQYRIALYYRDDDNPEVLVPTVGVEEGKSLVSSWYLDSAMRSQYGGRKNVSHISLEELQEDGSWKYVLSAVDPWEWQ